MCSPYFQLGYGSDIPFKWDASCSKDPDLPEEGGDDSDLEFEFECYRQCETPPKHETTSGLWEFMKWDNENEYNTSCTGLENNLEVSEKGCFRPFFLHQSGPLKPYSQEIWNTSDNPIKAGEYNINEVSRK